MPTYESLWPGATTVITAQALTTGSSRNDDIDFTDVNGKGFIHEVQIEADIPSGTINGDIIIEVFATLNFTKFDTEPCITRRMFFNAVANKAKIIRYIGSGARFKISNTTGATANITIRRRSMKGSSA
jgi:hypothetical protein